MIEKISIFELINNELRIKTQKNNIAYLPKLAGLAKDLLLVSGQLKRLHQTLNNNK